MNNGKKENDAVDTHIEALVGRFEELWRNAALTNKPQFHFQPDAAMTKTCAWLVDATFSFEKSCWIASVHTGAARAAFLEWQCPFCRVPQDRLSTVMIHLNDFHQWTWDMLANKFRPTLEEGLQNGPERGPQGYALLESQGRPE